MADLQRKNPTPPGAATPAMAAAAFKLLELGQRARQARSVDELGFLLVNATHGLTPYRQAVLWPQENPSAPYVSGVVQEDPNAPYIAWLQRLRTHGLTEVQQPTRLDLSTLPADVQAEWSEWLPAFACVIPLPHQTGALLLTRELAWTDLDLQLLHEWAQVSGHAWRTLRLARPLRGWEALRARWRHPDTPSRRRPWYRQPLLWLALGLCGVAVWPMHMTVLAPGELVPSQPIVIRAPIEGVIARFAVAPNDTVQPGQALFEYDRALIDSRVKVAQQTLVTAQTQFQQTSQLALTDAKYKAELAAVAGQIEEKRSEFVYLQAQSQRAAVSTPVAGVALFDDPNAWIGKPVAVGERILRIAQPGDVEIEAWLPVSDAVPLRTGTPVTLYLQADPLTPVPAKLHYLSHEATLRPDGVYAYRVRATLEAATPHRVGLKGTAKISGEATTLGYWLLRRPLAVARTSLGW